MKVNITPELEAQIRRAAGSREDRVMALLASGAEPEKKTMKASK